MGARIALSADAELLLGVTSNGTRTFDRSDRVLGRPELAALRGCEFSPGAPLSGRVRFSVRQVPNLMTSRSCPLHRASQFARGHARPGDHRTRRLREELFLFLDGRQIVRGRAHGANRWEDAASVTVAIVSVVATAVVAIAIPFINASLERQRLKYQATQELRFKSYMNLWARMRPLAIYDDAPINRQAMECLSKELSDWYFSANGGLMLTSHSRELYFALQGLVKGVAGKYPDWDVVRKPEPEKTFKAVLERKKLRGALRFMQYAEKATPGDWQGRKLVDLAHNWRQDVVSLKRRWAKLKPHEKFAVLQQVSSMLRTGLTYDVESRLR
jgi:hypothetical protein